MTWTSVCSVLALQAVFLVQGQTVPNCRPVGIPGCSSTATPGQVTYCCPNSYCNAAITCISCINATNTATCNPGNVQDSTRCCDGLTCVAGRCVSPGNPPPAPPTPAPPAPAPPAPAPPNCRPVGIPGCSSTATPGQTTYCCPNSFCNLALTCISCINATNTTTCSSGDNVQDSTRCCDGLTCVSGRCVSSPSTTPVTPATPGAPPADAPANCLAQGIPGCSSTATPGQTTYCCPNSYCNAALTCIACINATNTATCTSGNVQDSTRCCDGLTCLAGRCVASGTTSTTFTAVPATTTVAPTAAPTAAPTTVAPAPAAPPNCLALGIPGCSSTATPGQTTYCCPNSFCNLALTCISCINATNTATCSSGDNVQDSTRCCDGLTCVSGRCVSGVTSVPSTTLSVPVTTQSVTTASLSEATVTTQSVTTGTVSEVSVSTTPTPTTATVSSVPVTTTATTFTCKAMDETCTTSPDNCCSGLTCFANICLPGVINRK